MKNNLLLAIAFLAFNYAKAQSLDMVKSYASTGTVIGYSIATSSNGNVLIAGEFNGTVDFDPGVGVASVSGPTSSNWWTYLSCFDSLGNFLWVKTWNLNLTITDKSLINLAINENDEIILVGYFNSTADFDPDAGTVQLNATNGHCFMLSLTSNGSFIAVKNVGAGGDVRPIGIAIGELNSLLITGYYLNFTTDFDPSASTSYVTCAGFVDAFVLKLDSAFNFSWVKTIGSTTSEYPTRIAVDKLNNVLFTGYFTSPTLNLDPAGGSLGIVTNSGMRDGFICKLDATGNYLWSGKIGGSAADRITGLAVDTLGDIWIGGHFEGTCDLNPGAGIQNYTAVNSVNSDIFFSKISASGSLLFVKQIGNDGTDELRAIQIDRKNRMWLLGSATDTIDFDPDTTVFDYGRILGSFLTTYSTNGDLLFVRDAYTTAFNFAINATNNVFINIITSNYQKFNLYSTSGVVTTNYTSTVGNYNCLLKYSECSNQSVASITLNPATINACNGDTVLLSVVPTNAGNFPSYVWKNNSTLVVNQDSSSFYTPVYALPNSVISSQLISSNGCVDRYPTLPQTFVNNVSYPVTPTAAVYPTSFPICEGTTMNLYCTSTNSGIAPTFQWFKNGTIILGTNDSLYATTNYANLDTFSCLFVSNAVCATTDTILANLVINTAPQPFLSTYTTGANIIYSVATNGVSYQWYNCASGFIAIPGATGSNFTATANGSYALVVNDGNCSDTSICHLITTVGEVEINDAKSFMKINQNPFQNKLVIEFKQIEQNAAIQICDYLGRIVYQSKISNKLVELNTSEWLNGIYFIELVSDADRKYFKLIKN